MKQKQLIGALIGKFIKVVYSKNKSLIDVQGKVIDETENTIIIQKGKKQIRIIKSQVKIKNENQNNWN